MRHVCGPPPPGLARPRVRIHMFMIFHLPHSDQLLRLAPVPRTRQCAVECSHGNANGGKAREHAHAQASQARARNGTECRRYTECLSRLPGAWGPPPTLRILHASYRVPTAVRSIRIRGAPLPASRRAVLRVPCSVVVVRWHESFASDRGPGGPCAQASLSYASIKSDSRH